MAENTERFIVFCGRSIEPWVYTDEPFKMTREKTIDMIASGEASGMCKVIGFDLESGKCRDATAELAAAAIEKWAQSGEAISFQRYEFVELFAGINVARGFQLEDEVA